MRVFALFAILLLAGCGGPSSPTFDGPAFDPVAFFTGHVTSWGVEEDRAGQPTGIITTDCTGTSIGAATGGVLSMVQVLHLPGGAIQTRRWTLRRAGPGRYLATANDMAGSTTGIVTGRALHWRWILETHPGNSFENVVMDQWMYRTNDGAVMIRTVVTKLGIRLLEISEQFEKS